MVALRGPVRCAAGVGTARLWERPFVMAASPVVSPRRLRLPGAWRRRAFLAALPSLIHQPVVALHLPRLSVVTGAASPGTLGFEIAARLGTMTAPAGGTVLLTGRSRNQGARALEALAARGITNVAFDELDVADQRSIEKFSARWRSLADDGQTLPDLLVNNAAVLLHGSSAEAVAASMRTHVWGPACLMRSLRFIGPTCTGEDWSEWGGGEGRGGEGKPATRRAVVNVSSGDGELSMLNSAIRRALGKARTPADVLALALAEPTALALMSEHGSHCGPEAWPASMGLDGLLRELVEEGEELAFGPTPAYSVSKAALNALTRVVPLGGSACTTNAVCPGDIVGSRMYSGDGSGSGEWDVSVARAGT